MHQDPTAHRLIPVVVVAGPEQAHPLADALVSGGLPVAEITLRTPAGMGVISAMSARGDILVGAGTVNSAVQAREAISAGARFIVSPGLAPAVVEVAKAAGLPVIPGVATASEVLAAAELGLTTLKFFPARQLGGTGMLKALSAALPGISFIPTGGIGAEDFTDYLAMRCVAAVGGSWMVPPGLIKRGSFAEVAELCASAVARIPERQ